jgi:hypothetical protein
VNECKPLSLALFAYVVYHMMQCLFAALASSALASVRADTTRVYFLAGGVCAAFH